MASVYILFSEQLNKYYVGSCKDLAYRMNQHINKEFTKSFTARANDWILYFSINDLSYDQARLIESHIKRMKSRVYFQNLKKFPEITEKLKAKYKDGDPDKYRGGRRVGLKHH